MAKKKNIAFLFGAGASIKAGFQNTKEITETIIYGINNDGNFASCRSDESFYFSNRKAQYLDNVYRKEIVIPVIKFISLIKNFISHYHLHPITYEHIYFAVEQILLTHPVMPEYENPITELTIIEIENELCKKDLFYKNMDCHRNFKDIRYLCRYSMSYIQDLLSSILIDTPIKSVDYLNFIKDAYQGNDFDRLYCFTLNHDLVLEKFFEGHKLSFYDGFEYTNKYYSKWNPDLFLNYREKIKLLKLHGSTNWYRIRPYNVSNGKTIEIDPNTLEEVKDLPNESLDPWKDEFIAKVRYLVNDHIANENLEIFKDEYNRRLDIIEGRPKILIGTINKLIDYNSGIYNDLQFYFRKFLNDSNYLIIAGYSLGDRGVNNQIIDWLYRDYENRKILIIDPNVNGLRKTYNAVSLKFDLWCANNKLQLINESIENIDWEFIKKKLIG